MFIRIYIYIYIYICAFVKIFWSKNTGNKTLSKNDYIYYMNLT